MKTKDFKPSFSRPTTNPAQKTFVELFHEFNYQDGLENNHSAKTRYKYQNFAHNFTRYLESIGEENILPQALNVPILKYFTIWLTQNLSSCNKTHIAKHISRINKAQNYAVELGILPYNPTASFKVKRAKNKQIVNLNDQEFTTWINHKWKLPVYQQAQDLYIFQMCTGLSYADLHNYNTQTDRYGIWIEGSRAKTKKPFWVPLWHHEFKQALAIHKKYSGQLPYIENNFYNRLIREMASQLGIEKYLTTHTGRKTFASLKDENGWHIGPLGAMMGNTEKVLKESYINVTKNKIVLEIHRRSA